ncbi:Uncharacterized protein ImpH/VasB [Rhodovulum sp. P5]|uniref:type VI secretion system baseplate subunit TssG n=1 Tax=Rhodovulum sp. P5 TaxID=1564506 RepID=UPI0009C1C361|nr:type VI secretion system baseplate subunit TssG [Rhodovulum sp. P5]ARE41178.1 Uncharacterized protein ImpH/VasB [Rhodovulum sp. P5]
MASEGGESAPDLTHYARFRASPESYHILFALRLLEAELQKGRALGRTRLPAQDRVRLGQDPELAFPRTTISGFTPEKDGKPAELRNLFFGFWGPHGPMPLHLTEYARDRAKNHRDKTLVAFTDMITHRMLSLFYRAWADVQPAPGLDRGRGRSFERRVAAIAGVAERRMQDRDAMPDLAKRYFAGLMAQGPKNAEGLTQVLSAFFSAPVAVEEFVGCWLPLEPDDRWQLGEAALGQRTVVGRRVWSRSSKIRIRIGPLSRAAYERLLPGSAALDRLTALVRNYAGPVLDFDVNLVLRGDEVPAARLGGQTRLGQTSWLGRRHDKGDAGDLILTPPEDQRLAAHHGAAALT